MYSSVNSWPGWDIVDKIGQGSFGTVYKIEREFYGIKEQAALKVISIPQNKSDIEEMYNDGYDEDSITETLNGYVSDIIKEYALMKKLSGNTNIVNCEEVHIVKHSDDIGCDILIKMELLTPLVKSLDKEIPVETALKIGIDLCKALVLCQNNSIVHRDIKPENIFVSEYGDYKLGDFGVAKTVEKTIGGTKIGTYKYMAPEVYNNQPYGTAADIYSLGLVLYWLLNEKRMPFMPLPPEKIKAGANEESRQRRLSGEMLPAPHNGSEKLKNIVLKACAYNVEERYKKAEDLLAELSDVALGKEDIVSSSDSKVVEPKTKAEPIAKEEPIQEFQVGSVVEIGTYDNKKIRWRVYKKSNDACLLLCEDGLLTMAFDKDGSNEWSKSSLRSWLNKEFINSSFDVNEKKCIPVTEVKSDKNIYTGTVPTKDTLDSIFLLSISELVGYFSGNVIKPDSSKAISQEWWLRTTGDISAVAYVEKSGSVNFNGQDPHNSQISVRPAMWFNDKSYIASTAVNRDLLDEVPEDDDDNGTVRLFG